MSLRLQIKKKMLERSPRVKAIDFHQTNAWFVLGLYSGTLALHDYSNNTCIKTLEASTYPVRTVKFICAKHWIICGSDDRFIRVFNYNTMEKVKSIEDAHGDFLRAIIVHPSEHYVISCSDDHKIKIWNYEKDFLLVRTLDEHKHFVLALAFNPRDLSKFASASMDKTVKIWNLTTEGKANLTLTGHKSSVNCIDFYKGDKPHFATGSDDKTIKIWDYQTKQCLATIQSHTMAVTSVMFHPQLPILFSNSQDAKTIIHHSASHAILNTIQYNLGMGWSTAVSSQDNNIIAFGYDQGSVVIKIGSDDPIVSISSGKIIWTKSMEVYTANLKAVDLQESSGEKVKLSPKQLGSTQIYPTYIRHSPNSHHFALCNKKEFTVIKTASFKTVISGNGTNLVWQNDSDFAVLDNDVITIYRNFQIGQSSKMPFIPLRIFEGILLVVSDSKNTYLYDWKNLVQPLHRLDYGSQKAWWDQAGDHFAIATEEKLIIFAFNKKTLSLTQLISVSDRVNSGVFVNKVFYYMSKIGKIYFSFLGKTFFYTNAEKKQFILGAIENQERLYLFDKTTSVYSHFIPFDLLNKVVQFIEKKSNEGPQIPIQFRDRIAKVYHAFDLKRQAYKLVENQDHKFELALQLGYVKQAYKIATTTHSNQKIKVIGDLSLKKGQIELAIECFKKIDDLNTLLLIYSSIQLPDHLLELAKRAEQLTKMNVAYMCYFLTNNPTKCVDVLIKSKRYSEAALFCRTYCKDRISECVKLWKESLNDKSLALKISDPTEEEQEEEEEEGQGEDGQQEEASA